MKFNIKKNSLNDTLNTVSRCIVSTSVNPLLRGILIEAKDDCLTLTGSDGDSSIQTVLIKDDDNGLSISDEGVILIDAKYLIDIVRKIDSDDISVEIIDGSLTRFSGLSAEYKINGMSAEDYPAIDFSKPDNHITLTNEIMEKIIDQTVFACSVKETRPVLTGVNFKLYNGKLTATATDSYRLARKEVVFDSQGDFNITIPARTLNNVKVVMSDKTGEIVMSQNDKKAQFRNETTILQTRLLDGAYPETDRLIPDTFTGSLTISRTDVINAIDRSSFIKTDNMTINRLQLSENEIILTNRSQEIGEYHEILNGKYEGEPLDISFSGNYVMAAARALSGTTVKISFTGEMKPFVMTDEEDITILQLILPVRTYN